MRLTGKRIAILLAESVEDLEFYVPLMRLQEEGAEVVSAAVDLTAFCRELIASLVEAAASTPTPRTE